MSALASGYLAAAQAISDQIRSDERQAAIAAERSALIYRNVKATLAMFATQDEALCSPGHLALLREVALDSDFVDEIKVVRGGYSICGSWGAEIRPRPLEAPDRPNADGIDIFAYHRPGLPTEGGWKVAFMKGAIVILVSSSRYTDPFVHADLRLAIISKDGRPLAGLNTALAWPASSELLPGTRRVDGQLVTVLQDKYWTVAVASEQASIDLRERKLRGRYLSAGCLIAGLCLVPVACVARKHLSPAQALAASIRRREFKLLYQPIMDLKRRHCIGAEALLRWRRPDGMLVGPADFIDLAEASGQAQALTRLVIDEVLSDMAALLRSTPSIHIAINLSPDDVASGLAIDYLHGAMAGLGLTNSQFWLEVTERSLIDLERAGATLAAAQDAGHRIALDDFGTGYSSLRYLRTLPLDVLKIDKAFVDPLDISEGDAQITAHIVRLALDLGLTIVAEGVERSGQEACLRQLGVHAGQGWLYAKPMPAEDFAAFYRAHPGQDPYV
ncbi:EAL domain-containing protein [Achromobacter sp. RTa]|uniref:EAL domain-containing protein n=1 Tax=Achromobacter sp. RTa TaxID=1532557 RepID=UPI000689B190|nr:EAL domain-containing protein [Achromobacter sp. RTa]